MTTINIDEIQRDLVGNLQRVSAGETMLIMQDDKPIAELKPVDPVVRNMRSFGLCAGEFTVPVDFDAPLSENVLAEFECQALQNNLTLVTVDASVQAYPVKVLY